MKKVLSVILAVLMMLSMTTAAFAGVENKPVTNVNLIKGTQFALTEGFEDFPIEGKDLDYLVGAVFTVDEEGGQSFEDFLVDFKLSVGADMEAEFYGKYGTGTEYNKWMQPGEYAGEADGFQKVLAGDHHLFEEYGVKNLLTVEKVFNIETFYCALYVKPGSVDGPVDVSLGLDMYEKPEKGQDPVYEEVEVSPESVQEITVAMERPTAVIKMVEGRDFATTPGFEDFAAKCGIENIDMNYVIGAYIDVEDMGTGYDDYFVDFVLSFSDSAKGFYFGKYTGNFSTGTVVYDWNEGGVPADLAAGATNILSSINYPGSKMTVKEACSCVSGGFYSALYIDPSTVSAPITVSVDAAVYQEPEAGKPVVTEIVKASEDSVKEAEVAFTEPVANITMVAGKDFATTEGFTDFPLEGINTDYLVGAVVKVADKGEGFDNYLVDFNIDLSSAVKAKFYGTYTYKNATPYGWQAASNEYADIPAGGYNLLDSDNPLGIKVTVAEAADEIGTFYCALVIDPESVNDVVTATLNTVVFEAPAEGKEPEFITLATDDASNNTIETCTVLPVANITMIQGKDFASNPEFADFAVAYGEALDMNNVIGAVLKVKNAGQGFEDYMVDFKINLSEDVEAKFFGKYYFKGESTGWQGTTAFSPVPAGDTYLLNAAGSSFSKANLSVAEVVKDVDTFYCVLVVDPDSADDVVTASLDVVACEKDKDVKTEAVTVATDNATENTIEVCKVTPVANIKMVKGVDFAKEPGFEKFTEECGVANIDMNYVVGAYISIEDMGAGYEKDFVDFVLNLDSDVEAMFFASYTGHFQSGDVVFPWTSAGDFAPISAGSTNILSTLNYEGSKMTLAEAAQCVDGFYCAFYVKPGSVSEPVTVSLIPAVYAEPAEGEEAELVLAEPAAGSITSEEVAFINPVANITMVAGKDFASTEGFTDFDLTGLNPDYVVGAKLVLNNAGSGFENYFVDFKLNLSSAVKAKFLGKYRYKDVKDYGWQGTAEYIDVPAGDIYLLNADSTFGISRTVAQVAEEVNTFYCALVIDPESVSEVVTASLDVVMFETPADGEDVEFITVAKDEYSENVIDFCTVAPVANITMIQGKDFDSNPEFADFVTTFGEGLDLNNVIGAVLKVNNAGQGFEDYLVDFKINLSEDVEAKFFGKYYFKGESTGWQGTTAFSPVPAGDTYLLDASADAFSGIDLNLSVAEVARDVDTFYCVMVIDPATADDIVTTSLDVVIYDEEADVKTEATVLKLDDESENTADFCKAVPTGEIIMVPGKDFANTPGFESFAEKCGIENIDMNYVAGAYISIEDMGAGYEDSFVDFILNLDADVSAKFFGKYNGAFGDYDWTTAGDFISVKAGNTRILSDLAYEGSKMTLAEAVDGVGGFYCAFYVDPESVSAPVNVSLTAAVYSDESFDDYEVASLTEDSVVSVEVCTTNPVADIKLIPGRDFSKNADFKDFAKKSGIANLDMDCVVGAVITLVSTGDGFDDALVDFKLGLSEAVKAKLFGKYIGYDWEASSAEFVEIGSEPVYVLGSAGDPAFVMSLAEAAEMVGTFYCVLVVDPETAAAPVEVSLEAVVYDEPAEGAAPEYAVIDTTTQSVTAAEVCRIRPVAEIEMIDGVDFADNDVFDDFDFAGVDPESVVGAKMTITDMGKFFDDSLVDFRLNLSDDVEAKVYGSYIFNEGKANEQAFAWTSLTGGEYAQFKAGDNYVLDFDTELNIEDLTLAEVKENVGTFYCVFVINPSPVSTACEAINTTLDIVVYDEPADGEEVEYIAADCNNDNKATVFSGFDVIIDEHLDIVDYQAVVNIALGAEGYVEDVVKRADVDGDGFVDVLDAVLVERRYER